MASFQISIKQDIDSVVFTIKAETAQEASRIIRKITFDLYGKVILKSPVDTGRFRSNWGVSVGAYLPTTATPVSALASYPTDPTTISQLPQVVISNSLPYAFIIENGLFTKKAETKKTIGGFSKQAPEGVLYPSLKEITSWLSGGI